MGLPTPRPAQYCRYSNNFLIINIWCCSAKKRIFSHVKIRTQKYLFLFPPDLPSSMRQAHWFMFAWVLYKTVTMPRAVMGVFFPCPRDRNQDTTQICHNSFFTFSQLHANTSVFLTSFNTTASDRIITLEYFLKSLLPFLYCYTDTQCR